MSKITVDRALLEQALEALTWCEPEGAVVTAARSAAINALRAALAQEEQNQSDINWLKARPGIEQFIAGVGYDMTLTNERVRFEAREKVDVRQEEPVVVRAEALDLILEAAEVLGKVRVSCDAWEKYGLRDFLPDELTGTAGMLRDGSAFTTPPRREWVSLTDWHIEAEWVCTPQDVKREGLYFGRRIEAALKEKNT